MFGLLLNVYFQRRNVRYRSQVLIVNFRQLFHFVISITNTVVKFRENVDEVDQDKLPKIVRQLDDGLKAEKSNFLIFVVAAINDGVI